MTIQIRSFDPMPTRPCRYCLAMQDDSVFVDFDIDDNGCLYIIRISYDGYGCCHPKNNGTLGVMGGETTKHFIKLIEGNDLNKTEASTILSQHLKQNKEVIWEDALRDHGLI